MSPRCARALVLLLLPSAAATAAERRSIGRIERHDARLDHLVPRDAAIEVLADGFRWTEGPVWDAAAGRLLFSDIPNKRPGVLRGGP